MIIIFIKHLKKYLDVLLLNTENRLALSLGIVCLFNKLGILNI